MTLANAALDLQDGLAEAYDTLAGEFQSGVVVKLCKVDSATDIFTDLLTITDKRFWEYSNFRKNTLLEIADSDAAIGVMMPFTTHVKIDSDVYIVRQGDTLEPSGTNPVWQLFLDLYETNRQYSQL